MTPETWQQLKVLFQAAIELGPDERAAFLLEACAGDAGLRARAERLLTSHDSSGAFLQSPAIVDAGVVEHLPAPEHEIGKRIGPYEIIRELGHGGMGTVYLAVRADDQYRKQVAIKLVNRGMDTEMILRRFVMERQILANLEHPNIARLLEGGSTSDGLPYFVMEFIEGQPINEYCDVNRLAAAERLKLFRDVCGALQYAHQNLVVHRDIKPGNILVTADGVPKLLDFGIAKLLSPGWAHETGELTASMVRLMTPEYASPEQLRGSSITTATDVYSLGVVLYELLSGQHPYRLTSRSPQEIVDAILSQEPEKPSTVCSRQPTNDGERADINRTAENSQPVGKTNAQSAIRNPKLLKGDLDNIVLKALRKEPERRYGSVQELSEDIRRHLEGQPVTATPNKFSYRAQKFIQRNKAAVLAAAAIVLVLVTATGITAWQARVARRERDKAERRFNQVRKLATTVLFEYHDGIEMLPGSTPVRERMVKDALEYLDNLSAESAGDTSLQSELATAYFKVGEVQGAPSKSSLGDYAGALKSFKSSLAIRENLYARDSQNEKLKLDLTRSYQMVGDLSQATDDLPTALENYRRAFVVFDSVANKSPEIKRDLSTLHTRFGNALVASGELGKATENYRQAILILGELLAAKPDDRELRRNLAVANILWGDALTEARELKEALAADRAAFALLEPLVTPTNAQSRRDINVANARIADVLFKLGDPRAALEIQLKALALDEDLAKADPSNALARRDLQVDYYQIARLQSEIGDMKSALAYQRKSIAFCEAAVAANPASSESRADLGVAYFRFGEMLDKSGDASTALQFYRKAAAIEEAMATADPTNTVARGDLSEDYLKVSDLTLKLGNAKEALEGYHKALTIREALVAANPDDADGRAQLARIYESLGTYNFLLAKKDGRGEAWQEAKRRYQQSLEIWVELKNKEKLDSKYANKPTEISRNVAACDGALAKISGASNSASKK